MPLLHLPVQSGSSEILKKMNRGQSSINEYIDLIEALKESNSSIKFSSDFIIAYPGETDKDFEKTIELLKKIKFINTYSFIFSARPGTPAASLDTVDFKIAKNRLTLFQQTSNEIKKIIEKNWLTHIAMCYLKIIQKMMIIVFLEEMNISIQ